MREEVFEDEIQIGCAKGTYCFPCVSGLCPQGMDFITDCYPKLSSEQKQLFNEMMKLRAEIMENKNRNGRRLYVELVNF